MFEKYNEELCRKHLPKLQKIIFDLQGIFNQKKPKSIDEATDIAESYYLDLAEENGWRVYRIKNLILTFIEKNVDYKFDLTAKQHSDIVTVIEDQIKNISKDQKFLVLSEEEILNLMQ